MAKRLLVIERDDLGHFLLSVDAGTITIGSNSQNAELVLKDLHIARIHCQLEVDEEQVVIHPQAGAPKTAVRRELRTGEALQVGHSYLRLEGAPDSAPAGAALEGLDELRLADEPGLPSVDAWSSAAQTPHLRTPSAAPADAAEPGLFKKLVVIDGADKGRTFTLPQAGSTTIGQSKKNADIVLHDLYVTRVHCELRVQGDHVTVIDHSGPAGTQIDGKKITSQELPLGGVLRVGNSHLRLELAADAGERAAEDEDVEFVDQIEVLDDEQDEATAPAVGEFYSLPYAPVDQLLALENQSLGHFQIHQLLGRGQSGLVFRADDKKTNQVVALKVLSPDFPKDEGELQRFAGALKVVPHFQHAHLVTLYGAGRSGQHCWIAREYVEGESVSRLIQRVSASEKVDWSRACRVALHMGKVLNFLRHNKGVHGNITPRNILIGKNPKVTKLTDLLLQKALDGSHLQQAVLKKKRLAELPYLAPEQTHSSGVMDHLTDIYSLGAVLYAILAGQPPFVAASPQEVLNQLRAGKVVKPARQRTDVPPAFEAAVLKMMACGREQRFQSAADMLVAVEAIAREHHVES